MSNSSENVLLRLRTHPKVLVGPAVIQVLLIVAHVAVVRYFPESLGNEYLDEYGQLAVHIIIGLLELSYTVMPALRWWNSIFTVTDRRLQENWGVLVRHAREIPLDRIASVTTERGILDRITGCGTLVFHDASSPMHNGAGHGGLSKRAGQGAGTGIRFHDIPRIHEVSSLIDRARFSGGTDGNQRS